MPSAGRHGAREWLRAVVTALEPRLGGPRMRRATRAAQVAMTALTPVYLAGLLWAALAGLPPAADQFFTMGVQNALYALAATTVLLRGVAARDERAAWLAIGMGLAAFTVGNVLWVAEAGVGGTPALLSISDMFFVALYPCLAVGVVLLARRRLAGIGAGAVMDALTGGLAVMALGIAVVVPPIVSHTGGGAADLVPLLMYPVGDMALLAIAVTIFGLTRWQPGLMWMILTAGFIAFAVADSWYAVASATGAYEAGSLVDAAWWCGVGLIALSSCVRERAARPVNPMGWRLIIGPIAMAMGAVALLAGLVVLHSSGAQAAAAVLALGAATVASVRVILLMRHTQRLWASEAGVSPTAATGLATQAHFEERLAALTAERHAGAVLAVEITNLAEVNAVLGRDIGEDLMLTAARRMAQALGPADVITRGSAGDLNVLAAEVEDEYTLRRLMDRLRDAVDTPVMLGGVQVAAQARLGAVMWPEHGSGRGLVRRAEAALQDAAARGEHAALYRPAQDAVGRERLEIGGELREAVEHSEFVCHYQPKIEIHTGRLTGVEALVRRAHPRRGLLMPGAFIPVAEQGALMAGITVHVLEAALMQCRRWMRDGHPLAVAGNLSARQVGDPDLPRLIGGLLDRHRVPPELVELEVTETAVMADPRAAMRVLEELSTLGVGLTIDDFGVGQTSLAYLSGLPVQAVKIDRAFVSGVTTRAADRQIVRAICQLAEALGLHVVGEGVEDAETASVLLELGCHVAQGYYFGRPVPAADLVMAVPVG